MKTSIGNSDKKKEANKNKPRFVIACLLILVFAGSFLIPEKFTQAQSISLSPGVKSSSGIVEKVVPQNGTSRCLTQQVQEQDSIGLPYSEAPSEISKPSISISKETVTIDRESLFQRSFTDGRTINYFISAQFSLQAPISPRVHKIDKKIDLNKVISHKLDALSTALINQNIKGFAALKLNQFMSHYLAATGVELGIWMDDNGKESYFQDIFKDKGPWILVFLAMSPTSMHEYMQDLDLPNSVGDALEAKRLPVNMTLKQSGRDLLVETTGAYDLCITFRINEKDEVSIEKE